jgi:L-amino acid N-acyltransferase YncA
MDETWLKVPSMGVMPEGRGLGIGTLLMDAICQEGAARGFRYAWGGVEPGNQAIRRLHEKRGWVGDPNPVPGGPMRYWGELRAQRKLPEEHAVPR